MLERLKVFVAEPDRLRRAGVVWALGERGFEVVREFDTLRDVFLLGPTEIALADLVVVPASSVRDAVEYSVKLTRQEATVLLHVERGLRNGAIAGRMGLELSTVKAYLTRAFKKIGASSRTEASLHVRENIHGVRSIAAGMKDEART